MTNFKKLTIGELTIDRILAPAPSVQGIAALGIERIDHIELTVANARAALYFYYHVMGFSPVAYRGPQTGDREVSSIVLQQGDIFIVLRSPLRPSHPLQAAITKHSDHVSSISFTVPSCVDFYLEAVSRGGRAVLPPERHADSCGSAIIAEIGSYGDLTHRLVERKGYSGPFLPGYLPYQDVFSDLKPQSGIGLLNLDHAVGNVELGKMNHWVNFYEKVLGFTQLMHFDDKQISTEYSALMSNVMTNGNGKIKFPINEPAQGKRRSQIDEYLEFNDGPGVQHLAFRTADIITTIKTLRDRGLGFLRVPATYYDAVPARVGTIKEELSTLKELGVLVDRDDDGYLLQLFSKPVQDRPTLFFEFIQREGAVGFGAGNFKALFEALEREQAARGNL
jgi:4-hydroxyphenylpyruvate dioxygenase